MSPIWELFSTLLSFCTFSVKQKLCRRCHQITASHKLNKGTAAFNINLMFFALSRRMQWSEQGLPDLTPSAFVWWNNHSGCRAELYRLAGFSRHPVFKAIVILWVAVAKVFCWVLQTQVQEVLAHHPAMLTCLCYHLQGTIQYCISHLASAWIWGNQGIKQKNPLLAEGNILALPDEALPHHPLLRNLSRQS